MEYSNNKGGNKINRIISGSTASASSTASPNDPNLSLFNEDTAIPKKNIQIIYFINNIYLMFVIGYIHVVCVDIASWREKRDSCLPSRNNTAVAGGILARIRLGKEFKRKSKIAPKHNPIRTKASVSSTAPIWKSNK